MGKPWGEPILVGRGGKLSKLVNAQIRCLVGLDPTGPDRPAKLDLHEEGGKVSMKLRQLFAGLPTSHNWLGRAIVWRQVMSSTTAGVLGHV